MDLQKIKYKNLNYFRYGQIGADFIVTNEAGDYVWLSKDEFNKFIENKLDDSSEPYLTLYQNNFIKNNEDINHLVDKYRTKKQFLASGPCLHVLVVTLRCNQNCIYCHASAQDASRKDLDMSLNTAKKAVTMIFKTTSQFIDIEFQGGEPLLNWPVVKFVIAEAKKINKKAKKILKIKLVSNFGLMTEEKYKYLVRNKVYLCTSLDGPKFLHNQNRPIKKINNSHENIVRWVKKINKDSKLKKKNYTQEMVALTTISRFSLSKHKEIINEYIRLGYSSIFLRPLNPYGFAKNVWGKIGYTADDFIKFYKQALDYIIKINLSGKFFEEKFAKIFLVKILSDRDPNMMETRSPCGAGIGQLAYNFNGDIYTCDEGRMMSMMGDENFKLGNVFQNTYEEIVTSPVTRSVCSASCLDFLPGCDSCVFNPYCGVCPIYNYFEQGNIFGQMPKNDRCLINKAILNLIFNKLKDKKIKRIFENWLKSDQ